MECEIPLKTITNSVHADHDELGPDTQTINGQMNLTSSEIQEEVNDISVAVLGFGNYGRAISKRLDTAGIPHCIGSRSHWQYGIEDKSNSRILSYVEAASKAGTVVFAIPPRAYCEVTADLKKILSKKIVIDVSNAESVSDECHALQLANLLPNSYVVKAFNTVSAWSMEKDIYGASRNVFVCGDNAASRKSVMQLAQDLGFMPVDRGRLRAANMLEKIPLQLFPGWRIASWITLALLVVEVTYYYTREYLSVAPGEVTRNISVYHGNRILCWMALWLLSLVYLPGCIAGFVQLYRGTKYSRFPSWLDNWMTCRKQLGLYALAFAGMHACLSCIALAGEYVKYMSNVVNIPGTNKYVYFHYQWNAEVSLLFAVLAMTFFIVLGITSLPSVNQVMSWKEWDFVQSKLGYLTLTFAFCHVTIYVYRVYDPIYIKFWKYGIPPAVYFQPMLPGLVLAMKLILSLPGVAGKLHRIRAGWERNASRITDSKV